MAFQGWSPGTRIDDGLSPRKQRLTTTDVVVWPKFRQESSLLGLAYSRVRAAEIQRFFFAGCSTFFGPLPSPSVTSFFSSHRGVTLPG